MRALAIVLVACSAPPKPAPPPVHAPPPRDLAVAEPAPRPPHPAPPAADAWLVEASRPRMPILTRPINQPASEVDVAPRDLWSPCVRDFVQVKPPAVRRVLTAAFARYPTSCDAEKRIVIDAPREYRDRFVVLRGRLDAMTLDVVTCGAAPGGAVAIGYDGKRWTGIATTTQLGACTTTSVPDMPSLRRVLRELAYARDATVQDVVVTEGMKQDLLLVLDALDALSVR